MTRGVLLGAAVGVMAARALLVEPRRLTVTTHVVRSRKERRSFARIVQLSDLHLRAIGMLERRVASTIREARPDLVVITGDSVSRRSSLAVLDRFLAMLDSDCRKLAVLGNWDRWSGVGRAALGRMYERHGCRLLVNESEVLTIGGAALRVTGVDDLITGRPTARAALESRKAEETHLILSHCPGFRELLWREAADVAARLGWSGSSAASALPELMLAGHTHGGQITLLGFAPVRPRGSARYVAGWYRDGRPHLYVSRGLGTSGIRARLGAPPELPVFDVELAAGEDKGKPA